MNAVYGTRKAGTLRADARNWGTQPMATRRRVIRRRTTDVNFTPGKVIVYFLILAFAFYLATPRGMMLFAAVWGMGS